MASKDVVRIKVGMEVNYIASSTREDEIEIPRAEWEAMTEEEREQQLMREAEVMVSNHLDSWAYVVEDDA